MNTEANSNELPNAQGSEKYVLSTLMRDDERHDEVSMDRDWFYLPAHQVIYDELINCRPFEPTVFAQRLHDKGLLEHAGGAGAIADIMTYAVGNSFETHLGTLRDRMARRKGVKACVEALEALTDCSEPGSFLEALSGPFTEVFDAASGAKPIKDIRALARDFLARFEKLATGEVLPMGIPFGIAEVDAQLLGMHPQHYGIMSGRSGSGKSTLACQVLANLPSEGKGGLYLILERTEDSAFTKIVIQESLLHHEAVTDPRKHFNGSPDKGSLRKIQQVIRRFRDANIHIRKPDNRRLGTICAEIRRYVRLHGVAVVFVDQIGLIRGERIKGDSGEAELRNTSNTLQELAHELGICIVVLCQESADGETKNARAIEEDADWWLSIVQERDKSKETFGQHQHILIAKDSHNGKGGERLPLILDRDKVRFAYGFPQKAEEKTKPKTRFQ